MIRVLLLSLVVGCVGPGGGDKVTDLTGGGDSGGTPTDTGEDSSTDTGGDSAPDETGEPDTEDSPDTGCLETWTSSGVDLAGADGKLLGECSEHFAATTVRGVGDIDGDGQDDMAMWATNAAPDVVYVVQHPVTGPEGLGSAEGRFMIAGIDGIGVAPYHAPLSRGADMDKDGYSDLLVGTPSGYDSEGWTWLLQGPVLGELNLLDIGDSLYGAAGDMSGGDVAWLGDMNGDGWEDMLIGATGMDVAESDMGYCATVDRDDYGDEGGKAAGGAYVVLGPVTGSTPLSASEGLVLGEDGYDYAGWTLTEAEDLNGDGVVDLFVSAFNNCQSFVNAGAAYVMYGPVSGDNLLADADAKWMGQSSNDNAGDSLAVAGDVNGDGWPDLLVGAPNRYSTGGSVYLVLGPSYGTTGLGSADAILAGEEEWDAAGSSLDSAGDVNADGFDDLLIGAYHESGRAPYSGAAYVVLGPVTGSYDLGAAAGKFAPASGAAGVSVANAGDVDADGLTDLLIGAYGDSDAAEHAGAAYLLLGSGTFLSDVRASE